MAKIDLFFKLIGYWESGGIQLESPIINSKSTFINDVYSILPPDFKKAYKIFNGITEYDQEGFIFYSLQRLVTMGKKFFLDRNDELYDVIIFMDYMHENWWYGIRKKDDQYEIGIIPSKNSFKPITNSLDVFFELYMKDDQILYDYYY